MQAALEKELEDIETGATNEVNNDGDAEMAGAEVAKKEDDEVSEAGSEDLEQESSDDDEEDEEEGEGEGDEDMEMADGDEKAVEAKATNGEKKPAEGKQPEVMVH